jgi:hypothetical protein
MYLYLHDFPWHPSPYVYIHIRARTRAYAYARDDAARTKIMPTGTLNGDFFAYQPTITCSSAHKHKRVTGTHLLVSRSTDGHRYHGERGQYRFLLDSVSTSEGVGASYKFGIGI